MGGRRRIRSAIVVDPRGSLLWSENTQLFGYPFDFGRRDFNGDRILLQDEVSPFNQRHELPVSVSANGILASQAGSDESVILHVSLDGDSRRMSIDETQSPRRRSLDLSSVQALNADPPLR